MALYIKWNKEKKYAQKKNRKKIKIIKNWWIIMFCKKGLIQAYKKLTRVKGFENISNYSEGGWGGGRGCWRLVGSLNKFLFYGL